MRAFTLLFVLSLLALQASAVSVPFKWCAASSDDTTIQSIVSDNYPPMRGDPLHINVTGNVSKQVTSGSYNITINVEDTIRMVTGNLSEFNPVPWPVGNVTFTYSTKVPEYAPPGKYNVKVQAADQDGIGVFCIVVVFTLAADEPGRLDKPSPETSKHEQQEQQITPVLSRRPLRPINRWESK